MKKLMLALAITSVLGIVGCESEQKVTAGSEKIMKIATITNANHSRTKGLVKFGELVEKQTKGSVKIKVFSDSALGDDKKVLEGLKDGSIGATSVSTTTVAAYKKQFEALDLPFMFKDKATAYKVLDGPIGESLLAQLPEVGFIGINFWENGFRHLTNNKHEVKDMADIEGLRLRTMDSKVHIELWKTLKAEPTPMAFAKIYDALSTGELDGQENPFGHIINTKFYEVQKYLTTTGHVYNASPFLISKKFWTTLSTSEQKAIKAAAKEARDYQRALNEKEDLASIALLKEKGMTVTDLNPGQKELILETLKPLYQKYSDTLGADLINKLLVANK